MRKILLVIDMQNDFINGALGTPEAEAIVDRVAEEIGKYPAGDVIATRDTHPENYLETQEGRNLPVVHCVKGTTGWELHPKIAAALKDAVVIDKPTFGSKELAEKLLETFGGRPGVDRGEIAACLDDIEALKTAGKLFTPDTFADMAGEFKARSGDVVKALCLHVAHTCNLNCAYCFASQGKYSGERALMSFEVGRQALDFLIAHSGTRTNLEVDFFGGEPLMNWQVVKDLVAYARTQERLFRNRS